MQRILVRVYETTMKTGPVRRPMWFDRIPEEKESVFFPEIAASLKVFMQAKFGKDIEVWCVTDIRTLTLLKGVNPDWESVSMCISC